MEHKEWLSVNQLAQYFGISTRQVYRLKEHRDFPKPIRVGRSLRYDLEEVEKHLLSLRS